MFLTSQCHRQGGAAEIFNIGAQLLSLTYAKTAKVFLILYAVYWF